MTHAFNRYLAKTTIVLGLCCGTVMPAHGQSMPDRPAARSGVGLNAERPLRANGSPATGRVESRISSRVQSRLSNRIDRGYSRFNDPAAAIRSAEQQARIPRR